jgi:hypothetical protein
MLQDTGFSLEELAARGGRRSVMDPAIFSGMSAPRCRSSLCQSRIEGRRRRLTRFKLFGVALILSTLATPVFAQVEVPGDYSNGIGDEPAAFQSQYPNRDVLNRGQLTTAARAMTAQPGRVDVGGSLKLANNAHVTREEQTRPKLSRVLLLTQARSSSALAPFRGYAPPLLQSSAAHIPRVQLTCL